jgi:hypothetical protein
VGDQERVREERQASVKIMENMSSLTTTSAYTYSLYAHLMVIFCAHKVCS